MPSRWLLTALLCLFPCLPGCLGLKEFLMPWGNTQPLPPQVYQKPPTSKEIVAAINTHSARVQDVQAQGRLSVKGMPSLTAELSMQPHESRSRLRAELFGMTGTEVDLGSNPEMFWVWVKRAQPPGVYYARHDEFVSSEAGKLIPIQPQWLTEAFGVLNLDPYKSYEGPFTRENDGLELRWLEHGKHDTIERRIVVHKDYGYIVKQEWLRGGNLIASATASDFEYWPTEQVSLPHKLEVNVPEAEMVIILEMDLYAINRGGGDPERLYQPPSPDGVPKINIAKPQFQPHNTATHSPPPQNYAQPAGPSPTRFAAAPVGQNLNRQGLNGQYAGDQSPGASSYWQNSPQQPPANNYPQGYASQSPRSYPQPITGSNTGVRTATLPSANYPSASYPSASGSPAVTPSFSGRSQIQVGEGQSFSPPSTANSRAPLRGFTNWR